ncbi:hypothetical protein M1B34_24570 [Pseudomonas sp. MAFF 302030]|uniref:Uncharacterized protein n=1 Tax=Pseudomonas morbosilactucae TaxID=2938197 RepID=A0A9X2C828_9PSED|nr:hypothetical protein [Pseudomonas morbosilactucae]MCK9800766.1 hypothetical protein [Pseudomonas morbosilactucae]
MTAATPTANAAERTFWDWFTRQEARLFAFEFPDEPLLDELAKALSHVAPELTFELGPITDGKREFVISAGGILEAFPAVESLHRCAPDLPRWHWTAFRQRMQTLYDLGMGEHRVSADDVHYLLAADEPKVGIALFFDDYHEERHSEFQQLAYLFLDQALGEYAVETQVGFIEVLPRTSEYFQRAYPLRELPGHFDHYWGNTTT